MCADRVLVADSSRARLFSLEQRNRALREIADFVHPEGRNHGRELSSDAPGQGFDGRGRGRHALIQATPPKQQEAKIFARELAGLLNRECSRGRFERLILIAAPEFLGLLRGDLSKRARRRVTREITKNLVRRDLASIRAHLR